MISNEMKTTVLSWRWLIEQIKSSHTKPSFNIVRNPFSSFCAFRTARKQPTSPCRRTIYDVYIFLRAVIAPIVDLGLHRNVPPFCEGSREANISKTPNLQTAAAIGCDIIRFERYRAPLAEPRDFASSHSTPPSGCQTSLRSNTGRCLYLMLVAADGMWQIVVWRLKWKCFEADQELFVKRWLRLAPHTLLRISLPLNVWAYYR